MRSETKKAVEMAEI